MNYQNIAPSFMKSPYYYQISYNQYPFMTYYFNNTFQVQTLQSFSQQLPEIASEKNPNIPNFDEIERKLKLMHASTDHQRKIHWKEDQDKLLLRLVEIQKLQWKDLPRHFQNRTQNMCYSRYRRICIGTKDQSFTKTEEEMIVDLVNQHGEKWKLISQKIAKYTPKQIREKYLNCLRPNISKETFTLQQDLKICKYVIQHGRHWIKMQKILPGRSQGYIKGRYYSKLHKIVQISMSQTANS